MVKQIQYLPYDLVFENMYIIYLKFFLHNIGKGQSGFSGRMEYTFWIELANSGREVKTPSFPFWKL